MGAVRASILIPTHDRPDTLRLAVRSVLTQSVDDLEVLVIGDGVTDALREEAHALVAADDRVRFFDHEKGPHHGEIYRHDAVMAANSDAIFYLCDDDILMREHVADLLRLLEQHNFVQSLNGCFLSTGEMHLHPADLSRAATIERHLAIEPKHNAVSITGTAHSRSFYQLIDDPWATTPVGEWPDHHQWRKFFRHPQFSGATSRRMTALQFPTSQDGRDEWSEAERVAEMEEWFEVSQSAAGQDRIDELVARAASRRLEDTSFSEASARAEIRAMRETKSWRVTAPLRAIRRLTLRRTTR